MLNLPRTFEHSVRGLATCIAIASVVSGQQPPNVTGHARDWRFNTNAGSDDSAEEVMHDPGSLIANPAD